MLNLGQKQSDQNTSTIVEHDPQNEIINIDDRSIQIEKPNRATNLISKMSKPFGVLSSHELLELIFKKVDAIEDHLISLNVRIDSFRNETAPTTEIFNKTGSVDMEVLNELGLPAESQLDLEKLEANLKNVTEFRMKLVNYEFHL